MELVEAKKGGGGEGALGALLLCKVVAVILACLCWHEPQSIKTRSCHAMTVHGAMKSQSPVMPALFHGTGLSGTRLPVFNGG